MFLQKTSLISKSLPPKIASLSAILLAEMSGAALIFAENIPDQQVITAQDHQEVSGRYTTNFEDGDLVVTFTLAPHMLREETIQEVTLQLEQDSDKQSLPFSQVQAGLYEVRVSKKFLQAEPKLAVQLKTANEEYVFEDLDYQRPSEEVTSSESLSTVSTLTTTQERESTTTLVTEDASTIGTSESVTSEKPVPGHHQEVAQAAGQRVTLKAQEDNGKFDISLANVNRPSDVSSVQVFKWRFGLRKMDKMTSNGIRCLWPPHLVS